MSVDLLVFLGILSLMVTEQKQFWLAIYCCCRRRRLSHSLLLLLLLLLLLPLP